jgi:two-component system NtrC family sensor kinase
MMRIRRKWQHVRLGSGPRLDVPLVLLAIVSVVLAAALLGDLVSWLFDEQGPVPVVPSSGLGVAQLIGSRLLQVLLVVLAWLFWLGFRRRRLDQIRLRRSEQKYRTIINHAGEAIFLLDGAGKVLEWNKAAETLFGEPRRNVLGRPFRDIHICYGMKIEEAMEDASRLARSLTFEFPFPRRRPAGQISLTISPVAFAAGQAIDPGPAFVVIARDITSEKQFETKLSETEKLAGIGQLAAGIAHQLNTPLGSILLSAQMLEDAIEGEDEAEDVRRIIRQTDQCRTIIKGLLNFARPTGKERTRLNLAEAIRETAYLMEKSFKVRGVVVVIQENGESIVHGNRNELDQVFFNLLSNALDAMPGGGRISITLGDGEPGELLVEFFDEGQGIPPDQQDQVFLPFFTTKEYGKGTGLGLSIVARIVHEHGGRIRLESEPGRGTHFFISFPRPGFGLMREEVQAGQE